MQKMLSQLRRCIDEYNMIEENDKIVVGVSGGKDSTVLLRLMAELRRFYPKKYELYAVSLDLGMGMDYTPMIELCKQLDVPYIIKKTDIKQVVFDIRKESNPCSLCAKMRRGALNDVTLELGAKKVALGHHEDDAIETFFLSLFYEGRLNTFMPVTFLDRTGVTQIRPMLYLTERKII
ncbi:MAG: tRNA 2-thiocytidine biosynthesis protein TtcA, partial [Clostridia bacterium]|nr:tRNA 2-thiocytidine biosynthesis protein TtcA [Clostridia bacterium]